MVCFNFRRWKVGDLLMEYKKGSIVLKIGTVFDNGDVDPRPCHPSFIPIVRDDLTDDVYYLIITSKVGKYTMFEDKYYLVDEDLVEAVHLEVPSMINLEEIHKDRKFIDTVGGLPPFLNKDVIRKFKAYQEEYQHRYYGELKSLI